MPSSDISLIPHVCVRIRKSMPNSILDIGIGFGKYGFLAREYTDISELRYQPDMWQTRIDGIEIFSDYVGDLQRKIYNEIYIGDAFDCLKKLGDYDLILFIDVIEHLSKEKGLELVELIRMRSKMALISTPIKVKSLGIQYMKCGNKYECHISQWSKEELRQFGNVLEITSGKGTYLLEMRND